MNRTDAHQRLKEALDAKSWSAADLSRHVQLDAGGVRHHVNGTRPLPYDKAVIYGEALGVDPGWLYDGRRNDDADDLGMRREMQLILARLKRVEDEIAEMRNGQADLRALILQILAKIEAHQKTG